MSVRNFFTFSVPLPKRDSWSSPSVGIIVIVDLSSGHSGHRLKTGYFYIPICRLTMFNVQTSLQIVVLFFVSCNTNIIVKTTMGKDLHLNDVMSCLIRNPQSSPYISEGSTFCIESIIFF